MPRKSLGARLWLEPAEVDKAGKVIRQAQWVIRDGAKKHRTGCAEEARGDADLRLAAYLVDKYEPPRDGSKDPTDILVANVLHIYVTAKRGEVSRPKALESRVRFLLGFWGEKTLSEVNGLSCRAYAASRTGVGWSHATKGSARTVSPVSARRELEDLAAAITFHRKNGLCDKLVEVWLPAKGDAKKDFLTRSDAAKLLWAAWTARETYKGEATAKRTGKHIARFILLGLYTGTRHDALCGASIVKGPGLGWIDTEAGLYHRLREGQKKTAKRQPTIRLPRKMLNHILRWKRLGVVTKTIVEWEGRPVTCVRTGFERAVARAGLPATVTPHILRHTCATWLMLDGVSIWEAADYLGMTPLLLQQVYGGHHPANQSASNTFFEKSGQAHAAKKYG